MDNLFDVLWWKAATTRAVKTVCQTAVSLFSGQSAIEMLSQGAPIGDISWKAVALASLMAGLISYLTSLAGLPEVKLANSIEESEDK